MGYVTGLIATARAGGVSDVYIRTDVGGAYVYDRGPALPRSVQVAAERTGANRPGRAQASAGDRWLPLLEGSGFTQGIGVESIATEALSPARVYVVVNWPTTTSVGSNGYTQYNTSGEVLVSDDRGGSWVPTGLAAQNVLVGPNGNYRVETGERLAADPNAVGVVYFASRTNGLLNGVRSGQAPQPSYSWTQVQGGLPAPSSPFESSAGGNGDQPGFTFVLFDPSSIARDPVSGSAYLQTIYVGAHSSGVWQSKDGGSSWSLLSGGPTDPVRAAIAADGRLYVSCGTVGVSGAVWTYSKSTWTNITPAAQGNPYTGISSDPTNANIVMVGNGGTVWRSTNGGSTWGAQAMVMQGNDPLTPGTNPSAPPYYINATAGWNGGMAALLIDPANPNAVWWTNGRGVARTDDVTAATPWPHYTTDGGATWQAGATDVFPGGLVQPAVVPNPLTQGDVWVTFARNSGDVTTHPLYRSQNGGATFQAVSSVDSAQYAGFGAGTAVSMPFVYLLGRVGGAAVDTMYKSEDLGQSWVAINAPAVQALSGVSWVEGDMRTPNLVYVARGGRGVMYGTLLETTKQPLRSADEATGEASRAEPQRPFGTGNQVKATASWLHWPFIAW
jgi:hypothetical protein